MTRDILFITFNLICILTVIWILNRREVPLKRFLIILGGWILLISILALTGVSADFSTFPPRMALILFFALLTIIWFTVSKASNSLLEKIPARWIVSLQSFRVMVELFIWWAFIDKAIPVQMTFEGRNFDILAGITAPLVALLWLKPGNHQPVLVLVWNLIGLGLLFNIVAIALLSMPTPARYFMNDPANTIVASFPWILLPGVLVTLAFALHLFSIKQMIKELRAGNSTKA